MLKMSFIFFDTEKKEKIKAIDVGTQTDFFAL